MHSLRIRLLVLVVSFTALRLFSADPPPRTDREKQLPPTRIVESKKDVESAYGPMTVSNPYPTTNPLVMPGRDTTLSEIEEIENFIEGRGEYTWTKRVPKSELRLYITRYHMGDARVTEVMKKAKAKGIGSVIFITDLNDSVDVEFKDGEKKITDFKDKRVKPNDSPNGKQLKALLDSGFSYGDKDNQTGYLVFSQPVFNKEGAEGKIFDIMHEKSVVMGRVKDGQIVRAKAISGTANMVPHDESANETKQPNASTRYNRVRTITDPELAKHRMAHAIRLTENFGNGGDINDVKGEELLRVNFQNGWVETAYTNGAVNPNDRIAAVLLHGISGITQKEVDDKYDRGVQEYFSRVAKDFEGIKIKEVIGSHFVNTYGQGNDALLQLMERDKDAKFWMIADDKFNEVRGFGHTPKWYGVDVLRAMGRTLRAVPKEIADRADIQIYQRGIDGIPEKDLDGPPLSRYLWHDKTTIIKAVTKDGKEISIIFTGSMNFSNHKENAEDQDMIVVPSESQLAKAYEESIRAVVKNEPQFVIDAYTALLRNTIGRFVGHSPLEVTPAEARKIGKLIGDGDFEGAKKEIAKISERETSLTKKPDPKVIAERLAKFEDFMNWHKSEFPNLYGRGENYYLRKILDAASILTHPEMDAGQVAWELRGMLWSPKATQEKIEERAKTAWKKLGREGELPERRDPAAEPEKKPGNEKPKRNPRANAACRDASKKLEPK